MVLRNRSKASVEQIVRARESTRVGQDLRLQPSDDPARSAQSTGIERNRVLGVTVWSQALNRDVGSRIHLLIGELVRSDASMSDIGPAARRLLRATPVRGARVASVRMMVASAAGTYLRMARPDATLIGVERRVGAGVADLVWDHDGSIVIDELKSGVCDVTDPPLIAQVGRLLAGGQGEWGDRFVGVRLVPLSRIGTSTLITAVAGGQLVPAAVMPAWMAVK